MRASSAALLMILVAVISAGATYVLMSDPDGGAAEEELVALRATVAYQGAHLSDPDGAAAEEELVALRATVAYQAAQLVNGDNQSGFATIVIPVTTTPDPNVIMITVTPGGFVAQSDDAGSGGASALGVTIEPAAVLDDGVQGPEAAYGPDRPAQVEASLFGFGGSFTGTQEDLPEGCLLHLVRDGEFPTLIISNYELPPQTTFIMMAMNGLTEETATGLQIGDPLVVPFDGCPVDQFLEIQGTVVTELTPVLETAVTEATAESDTGATVGVTPGANATGQPTPVPIPTLAPTVVGSFVQIVNILSAGDLAQEGVEIVNNGVTTDVSGWTLSDGDGNVFTFPSQRRLFSGASVTIASRTGTNTAVMLFWGQDAAVFSSNDVIVLRDANGNVMSSVRVP